MSTLTRAHHEVANLTRNPARETLFQRGLSSDDVEIDGSVKAYHRHDRYRELNVTASNRKYLEELAILVEAGLAARHLHTRIFCEITRSAASSKKFILNFSVWPL